MTNAQFLVGEAALFAPYVSASKTYRCPADGSVEEICGLALAGGQDFYAVGTLRKEGS